MTHKEVVEQALNHKEGKVAVDFGGSSNTGIHCRLVEKLQDYYGLEKRPVKVVEPYQMLGSIDDDLKDVISKGKEHCMDTVCNILLVFNNDK